MLKGISNRAFQLVGGVLALFGVVVFVVAMQRFNSLPNYQRLASLVPLTWGCALLSVDTLRDWNNSEHFGRKFAIGSVLGAVGLPIGTILWWLFDPSAMS